ncbi:MAG: hypothetical protein HQK77_20775 [Desulfobacterales bacterium]|nr:hypothetical protein [Desulfobacterales bacterium]
MDNCMLQCTINNSISSIKKHFKQKDLIHLFYAKRFSGKRRYALDVLFTEASLQEVVNFMKKNQIPFNNLNKLYLYYKTTRKGRPNEKFEWLLREL